MTKDRLLDAIGKIDDKYIEEADALRIKKNSISPIRQRMYKSVAAAACIALVGVGALSTMSKQSKLDRVSESAAVMDDNMSMAGGMSKNAALMEELKFSVTAERDTPEGIMEDAEDAVPESANEKISMTAVVNPMTEVSFKEMTEVLHLKVNLPKDAVETGRYIYNLGDEKLGEVNFTLGDIEYCFRVKQSSELEDISGMYYTFDVDKEYGEYHICLNTSEQVGYIIWFEDGYSYSISLSEHANEDIFCKIYNLIKLSMGGTGEVKK